MKRLNQNGFTLVEIIVAMALIGIIAVTFIPLMTAQYVNINRTGDQSKITYDATSKAEVKIKEVEKDVKDGTITTGSGDVPVKIKWPGKSEIVTEVKIVEEEATTVGATGDETKATGTAKDSESTIKAGVPVD